MKSRLAFVAATAALSISLAACGGGSSDSGASSTLELQTGVAADTSEMTTLKSIAADFEKANPGKKINLVAAGTNYENDIKVRLSSGNVPDIWMTHGWSLLRYSKFLTPLQDEPWAKNVVPALDPVMRDKDGSLYAMPTNVDITGIMYNKDVLEKAGFKPEDIKSWDDFMKASLKAKANGASAIYAGGKSMAGTILDHVISGAYSEDDLSKMKSGTFVGDKYGKALELIAQWRDAGLFNPDYSSATKTDMSKALAQGQALFEFGPSPIANDALKFNPQAKVGFIPIPTLNGGPSYLDTGERTAYGVSKTTKDPAGAKAFLAFLAKPENETKMAAASAAPPGLADAQMSDGPLNSSYDTYVTQAKTPAVPYFDRVYLPNGAWSTMGTNSDSIITKQSDVNGAVQQMEATYKSLYGQGK
ncbi:ABC transporter substrate-binding protein [Pseudarthrobacter sp. YS3]|uniref:ABC transporter substrate-binding protein n=1 Tax=Pseudarthrobacter sp. YS3 TaxID=3453718 RepID=UPI003EEC969A